ncbi:hypothetical protein F2Q69_00028294 [Brassica cretica]|uniref:Uncharacterized protein n=1 Tax=Brassica cretica TaxID=69181 RepID=A0A8S9RY77_BRACR|nr:hypothetical protein F2Q69_00028294 [Brassica cretica]
MVDDSSELAVSKAERISTWAGRSARAAGRSDRTSRVPTGPKSSESLRILALEKYPKEKFMIGSNKAVRSSAQSLVHAVRAKRAKREKLWSESELVRPKLILACPSALACEVGQESKLQYGQIGHPVMVPAKAPFRTYAGRSSTLHSQSVRYGKKHESRLKCSERPELHVELVPCTDLWIAAHH